MRERRDRGNLLEWEKEREAPGIRDSVREWGERPYK